MCHCSGKAQGRIVAPHLSMSRVEYPLPLVSTCARSFPCPAQEQGLPPCISSAITGKRLINCNCGRCLFPRHMQNDSVCTPAVSTLSTFLADVCERGRCLAPRSAHEHKSLPWLDFKAITRTIREFSTPRVKNKDERIQMHYSTLRFKWLASELNISYKRFLFTHLGLKLQMNP